MDHMDKDRCLAYAFTLSYTQATVGTLIVPQSVTLGPSERSSEGCLNCRTQEFGGLPGDEVVQAMDGLNLRKQIIYR